MRVVWEGGGGKGGREGWEEQCGNGELMWWVKRLLGVIGAR